MRKIKFLVATMLALAFTSGAWAADGDTFTARTTEGVDMTFKVISEADKTCQVYRGNPNGCCIDQKYAGTVTVPATANGYTVTTIGESTFIHSEATSIILSEGITTIDDMAFLLADNAVSISLPSTLRTIGEDAIEFCNALTSLVIPEGVTTLPTRCIDQCDELLYVEIPASVTTYGDIVFRCAKLKKVVVKNPVPATINNDCFENRKYATLAVPEEAIDDYRNAPYWSEFKEIVSMNVFTATTVEGVEVTYKQTNSTNCQVGVGGAQAIDRSYTGKLTIPEKVNGLFVTAIADQALNACQISELELPAYISYIGDNSVSVCSKLKKVTAHMATPPQIHMMAFSSSTNSTLYVADNHLSAYREADVWKGFRCIAPILDDPDAFADRVLDGSTNSYIIYKVISEEAKTCQVGLGTIDGKRAIDPQYTGSVNVPATVNGYQVTKIASYAFLQTNFASVTLPTSLTSIGSSSFSNCYKLTSITIPEGVTSVGADAFLGSDKLETVTLPSSLKSLPMYMFHNCASLSSVSIPDQLKTIGNYAFYGCKALTEIVLPSTITNIGNNAFNQCSSLVTVYAYMPTPPNIDANCFSNRANATLYVPMSSLDEYLAKDYWKDFNIASEMAVATAEGVMMHFRVLDGNAKTCEVGKGQKTANGRIQYEPAIPTDYTGYITIPTEVLGYTVTRIGPYAFNNVKLTGIGIPSTIKSIKYQALYSTNISSIIIPEGVTEIDESAFYGNSSLTVAMLPSSLTSIGKQAFYNCTHLTFVSIPGNTTIGANAFNGGSTELYAPIQSLVMGSSTPKT